MHVNMKQSCTNDFLRKKLSIKSKQGRKDTETHICHMFAAL